MDVKVRIKMGAVEVDYEGPEKFLKEELPELLAVVTTLYNARRGGPDADGEEEPGNGSGGGGTVGTTGTLAAKLGVKTEADLALAAAARITLVSGQDTFTRSELLTEMRTASAYYKKSYTRNLTATIRGLCKNSDFLEIKTRTFSLSGPKRKELEQLLA